jgi:hypothetical protein
MSDLMPSLGRMIAVHGMVLEGDDLIIQGATSTLEWTEFRMPLREALKLHEWISKLLDRLSER